LMDSCEGGGWFLAAHGEAVRCPCPHPHPHKPKLEEGQAQAVGWACTHAGGSEGGKRARTSFIATSSPLWMLVPACTREGVCECMGGRVMLSRQRAKRGGPRPSLNDPDPTTPVHSPS